MKKKKKLEFYQKWIVACMLMTILAVTASYMLAAFGMDSVEGLSIALVNQVLTVDAWSILGYACQNSIRAWAADNTSGRAKK